MDKTKRFMVAMYRWAKIGFRTVKKEEYVRRLTICEQCHDGLKCPKCGCLLIFKTALPTERCPDGKWDNNIDTDG